MYRSPRRLRVLGLAGIAVLATTGAVISGSSAATAKAPPTTTASPIKHIVVIFDENVSYDHYFGTYPKALNTDGTTFTAATGTPRTTI